MNAERKNAIKNYEATKSGYSDFTYFEDSEKERLQRKKDFLKGIDYTPDYDYPNLDNLRFNEDVKNKKSKTYEAVLELEAAKSESDTNLEELKIYADYHEKRLKRMMLVEAARDINEAHDSGEQEVAIKAFKFLNNEVYGEFNDSDYKSMLSTEKKAAELFIANNPNAEKIKSEFLDYFKSIDLSKENQESLVSDEDLQKIHEVILQRYADILSVVPDTDDSIYYNADQCVEIINKSLEVSGLSELGWQAEINESKSFVSTNGSKFRIFLPTNTKRNANELRRLIIHEQEVHARSSKNGKETGFKPLAMGTEGADDAEEGLAVLMECAVAGNLDNASYNRARDRYITAGLALGVEGEINPRNARNVFEVLWRMLAIRSAKNGEITDEDIITAKDKAYDHVENAFKGTEFWMAGVIYTKLKIYYEGLKKNAQYFHENIDDINHALDVALIGKYDHTDKEERDAINSILNNMDKSELVQTEEE